MSVPDIATGDPAVPRLHLVTVLFNGEGSLRPFLDSLLAQELRDWRLIAIDNASADQTCRVVDAYPDDRITLVRNAVNLGFAKAANQGFRLAAGQGGAFFVLINSDTTFAPNFLGGLIDAHDRLPAGVLAPRIMCLEDPEKAWYVGAHFRRGWMFEQVDDAYDPNDTTEWRQVEFASGCCLGVPREVLRQVGLLDESFFVYWEDADFCLRLGEAGIPIYYLREPSALHLGQGSFGGAFTPAASRLYFRSNMQFLRKHCGMRYALRCMVRLLLRERGRPDRGRGRLLPMAAGMARGLAAPLVAVGGLDA